MKNDTITMMITAVKQIAPAIIRIKNLWYK